MVNLSKTVANLSKTVDELEERVENITMQDRAQSCVSPSLVPSPL